MSALQSLKQHPSVEFALAVAKEQSRERLSLTASGVAFWFVIALFPALIGTLMILGLVLSKDQLQAIIEQLQSASPASFGGTVLTQIGRAHV